MSTDISDENFSTQQLSIKAFNSRVFRPANDSLSSDPAITNVPNVVKICGIKQTSMSDIATSGKLFVMDFFDLSQWNETSSAKCVASVIAYFCYNDELNKLLSLTIHIVDTNVTYTPFDRPEEWSLARIAAVEISFQQMQHYADTHAAFLSCASRHCAT